MESEARKLLVVKERFEQCQHEYETQRLLVCNALVNLNREFIDVDGFRITYVPESTVMVFTKEGLRTMLMCRGLNETAIEQVIATSKIENARDSIIRITKLKQDTAL
jgi:hypothetical protein